MLIRRIDSPLGLLGRILAILLLTVIVEVCVSAYLYQRSSDFAVREDEARRLAEHLVVARKVLSESPVEDRMAVARSVTTDRYVVRWSAVLQAPPPFTPALDQFRRQILAWEPSLASGRMGLRLASPGRDASVLGALQLADGSWMLFRTHELVQAWDLSVGRIALALAPALALFVLGGLLIRVALAPVRLLARATTKVGSDDGIELPETGTREVRQLIRAFNTMQHRIHDLIDDRTQALAAVGHDLRTPLARVQLRVDAMSDPQLRDAIQRDVGEMDGMIGSLLAFLGGDGDPERPTRADVAVIAATIVDEATDRGADARYSGLDHAVAEVRPLGFRRALVNLVENGLHYGDVVQVSVERGEEGIRILVEDGGPGIPEDQLQSVLRPFTRLDDARARNTKGLGLGLAIVAKAIDHEGGRLTLSNRPEGGLRAEVLLPA